MPAFTTAAIIAGAAVASTAVSVVSGIEQKKANDAQAQAFQEQAAAQKESARIQTNSERASDANTRRQVAREERRRRAFILSSAANTGSTGSSGSLGAGSTIGASFGAARAGIGEQAFTSRAISSVNQEAADAATRAGVAAFDQKKAAINGQFYQGLIGLGKDFATSDTGKTLLGIT